MQSILSINYILCILIRTNKNTKYKNISFFIIILNKEKTKCLITL